MTQQSFTKQSIIIGVLSGALVLAIGALALFYYQSRNSSQTINQDAKLEELKVASLPSISTAFQDLFGVTELNGKAKTAPDKLTSFWFEKTITIDGNNYHAKFFSTQSLDEKGKPNDSHADGVDVDATSLDSEDMPVDSLVSFFKTGILYFKPIASLTTTFNPFRELLKLLSNEERELIGGIRLPFADQTTGIGPFNLKHAAFLEKSTDDEANSESEESEVNRTIRASIKPYSIETCYGYWVPSFFNHELKEKLDAAGAIKINKWMELQKKLNTSQESLEIKYQEYLDAARQALKIVPNLSKYLNEISVNPFDPKLFTNFFNRVHMYLDSPDRIERLSLPFVSGAIPEIWDDSQAYLDFHTSFFEYLEYVAKQSQNKPKVPGKILNAINADEEFDAEDLMSALEIHLEENGWSENDWSEK